MRIVIVGPGALGSLLTARISLHLDKKGKIGADNDIHLCLLDYKPERAEYLAQHGLILEVGDRKHHCSPFVTTAPEICSEADILFLCVKATALDNALERIRPFLSPLHLLIAMQNGIGHLEVLETLPCLCGGGVTSEGATLISTGRVRHGGAGLTRFGLLAREQASTNNFLERVVALFNAAGLSTQITNDLLRHVWAKLFVNVGINALTAINRCRNGELLESCSVKSTMEKAVREAELVARAKNIPVEGDPVATTFNVCEATSSNISSMLQDVRNRRQTEIDAINGAVVAEGERLGIATPVNKELVRLVREIEMTYPDNQDQREYS